MEFKYLLFWLSIDLFHVKDFKRNLTDGNLIRKICFLKRIWCCSFHGEGISVKNGFWVVNTWQATVRKRLKRSINYTHTFPAECCRKPCPRFFLTMSYPFFIAKSRRVLKAYFAWKQLRIDYSKNIWKEKNHGHGFVCLLVGYMSVKKKIIEKCNSVVAGAQKLEKVVSYWPNFDPDFIDICRV